MLTWPALYNGYPLLHSDSTAYLSGGRAIVAAFASRQGSRCFGMRSLAYTLGIYPFHRNETLWPVVGLNALLTAYILWLVIRSLFPHRAAERYLLLVAPLAALTSVSWYVSLVMPDIYGPLLYLSIYLLTAAAETLTRFERATVALIAGWGVVSHVTHVLLAMAICLLLGTLVLVRSPAIKVSSRAITGVTVLVITATASVMALHTFLCGQPNLSANMPPILAAKVIGDGPGQWYLRQQCGDSQFALCAFAGKLPESADYFLWNPNGVWVAAKEKSGDRIKAEEIPFVLAVFRTYPSQELGVCAASIWKQLGEFGVSDLVIQDWVPHSVADALPRHLGTCLNSRQFNHEMPLDFFTAVQFWTVAATLPAIAALFPMLWRKAVNRLTGLGIIVFSAVIANAMVTASFAVVADRYQGRVVWMMPFFAGVLVFYRMDCRGEEGRGDAPSVRRHE